MSNRSRKKRPNDSKSRADAKAKFIHSKREYITSEDGWTHVTDRKWNSLSRKDQSHNVLEASPADMSLEEMVEEHSRYKQQWESSDACGKLKEILSQEKAKGRYEVKNVVCIGLGSLQALPMDWRRSSHTQLAALKTIMETLNINCRVTMQDPRSTELDKLLLDSMECELVNHPEAFQLVTENSLVYAIHCPFRLLWEIKEKVDPALLISNDLRESRAEEINYTANGGTELIGNDSQQQNEELQKMRLMRYEQTLSLIEDCGEIKFPQLRNDFSSTMIYWRHLLSDTRLQEIHPIGSG